MKPYKVKLIIDSNGTAEKRINEFFSDNPKIELIDIKMVYTGGSMRYLIIYKEPKQKNDK